MTRLLLYCVTFAASLPGATYYLDCAAGNDEAAGTSSSTAWKSLARLNRREFIAGDRILLRRETRCTGMLAPKGSGRPGLPIQIGAYGSGALPAIDGRGNQAALRLFNQQHWEIETIETVGGDPHGVLISGDRGPLRDFRLTNLVVRDVTGPVKTKSSGLVTVLAGKDSPPLEDIVLDGITAFNTTQWAGIIVHRGKNVTVRNSIVHDVYGDGIVLFQVDNGLIETSAAWNTGLEPVETIGTPNGIWTWSCRKCTVRMTEGFFVDSPGVDGGVYDIDWGNDDNIVEHNFAHDAQGYCAAVFAAGGRVTTNSVVRPQRLRQQRPQS